MPEKWVKVADDIALVDIGTPAGLDFVELTSDAWVESRVLNSVWVYTEDEKAERPPAQAHLVLYSFRRLMSTGRVMGPRARVHRGSA